MKKSCLLFPLLLIACGPQNDLPASGPDADATETTWTATLPDGTQVSDMDAYAAAIANQIDPSVAVAHIDLSVATATKTDAGTKGLTFGQFHVGIQPDASYLGGCVNRGFLHLVLTIDNANMPSAMVELHLLAWFEGGKPCFAVMNTGFIGYGWCYKACVTNTKNGLKLGIKNGLISAGVVGATATIISAVVAPVAELALAM